MWMEVLAGQNQVQKVMDMNQKTERFGLCKGGRRQDCVYGKRKNT